VVNPISPRFSGDIVGPQVCRWVWIRKVLDIVGVGLVELKELYLGISKLGKRLPERGFLCSSGSDSNFGYGDASQHRNDDDDD